MVRPHGGKLLSTLETQDGLGIELGRVCIDAKLPMKQVGLALGVSRFTIHKWFLGSVIANRYHAVIEAFISQVRSAMEVGRLPAKDWQDARKYFDETKNAV